MFSRILRVLNYLNCLQGPNGHTLSNWRTIFYLSGAIRMVATLPYLLFASGELADWTKVVARSLEKTKSPPERQPIAAIVQTKFKQKISLLLTSDYKSPQNK